VSFALVDPGSDAVAIHPLGESQLADWLGAAEPRIAQWVRASGFKAAAGSTCLVPAADGGLAMVLLGLQETGDAIGAGIWDYAGLPRGLPAGRYRLDGRLDPPTAARACLGWALGTYRFERYRKADPVEATLEWPATADRGDVLRQAAAIALARDLINTPANDLGTAALAEAARELAGRHGAAFSEIVGDDLLAQGYPTIHAVGRASVNPPRLIDIRWGDPSHPTVTVVGKGVVFDSGGLDIKPSGGMLMMKKDMGGAAHALALGSMVMDARLKVRLRVLVPAVENAISGNAFRPLDVIRTRKGITVEVGNTDAEGRLILCDALAEADAEKPDMIIDYATLTGAARVALGPELPALFCNSEALAGALLECGTAVDDPMWRLPLWAPYREMLKSQVADTSSTGSGPFAGSVTAALYLEKFVSAGTAWAHFDLYAWNARSRPGRPEGGEAMSVRAAYEMLRRRFG
jgi:leucyl aminopeptidase